MDEGRDARRIEPPIFVWGDGDLNAFDSPESAANYNEPVDVEAGLCAVAFDSLGQKLELYVVQESVKERVFLWTSTTNMKKTRIRVAPEHASHEEEFRQVLIDYLERRKPERKVAQETFRELMVLAFPLALVK